MVMGLNLWQTAIVVVLFLLLFGRGRIPQLMSDVAAGIRGFRSALTEDEQWPAIDEHQADDLPHTHRTATTQR